MFGIQYVAESKTFKVVPRTQRTDQVIVVFVSEKGPAAAAKIVAAARKQLTPETCGVRVELDDQRPPDYVQLRTLVTASRDLANLGLSMSVEAPSQDARRMLTFAGLRTVSDSRS